MNGILDIVHIMTFHSQGSLQLNSRVFLFLPKRMWKQMTTKCPSNSTVTLTCIFSLYKR